MNLLLRKSASLVNLGGRGVSSSSPAASFSAVQKLVENMKGLRSMPWEPSITEDAACKILSSFWGIAPGVIRPGDVLDLSTDQMEGMLVATTSGEGDPALDDALFTYAESVTRRFFGNDVYFRGIVEFSNVCENDCSYCGIRKHQPRTWRYTMPMNEVIEAGEWAFLHGMGTLMLQSGQLDTPERNSYIEEVVKKVRERTVALDLERRVKAGTAPINPDAHINLSGMGLCVALSVGELPASQYRAFRDAGAERYLLRIETSNPDLFSTLHPLRQTWDARLRALQDLKAAGFQVGTGVMVGLPGQTMRDLARDIMFFREIGADMVGCGPYITEAGTPTAEAWEVEFRHIDKKAHMASMLKLTTRVNALTRITLGNVNVAATTALQAIDPLGRELALRRGANILMPILTPTKYREHYTLYEGKPCITDTAAECENCLKARLSMIGKALRPGIWGDPPSYRHRLRPVSTTGNGVMASSMHRHDTQSKGFHGAACWAQDTPCNTCGARPDPDPTTTCKVPTGPSFTAAARANGPAILAGVPRGSDVLRTNLGIFGKMNSGKSTLMNRLTRSEVSIVDSTPGTTSDTKIAMMELHAAGPVKLFDTAGVDEVGVLGDKKRRKVWSTLKECDVAVIVVNLQLLQKSLSEESSDSRAQSSLEENLHWEKLLLGKAAASGAAPVLVFNTSDDEDYRALQSAVSNVLSPDGSLPRVALSLADPRTAHPLGTFLERTSKEANAAHAVPCLPEEYLSENAIVFLNIPMDAETPSVRLLRPQALVQEEAIRKFATTYAYRMNLDHARSGDPELVERERRRFLRALAPVLNHTGPALIVTDSQAVDIVHPWTLDPVSSKPLVNFTTFSIAMIHRQSRGDLPLFAAGIQAFKALRPGDRVLVAEACNHNRITELCNDIGMVQIPRALNAAGQGSAIHIEHAFGREFPEMDDPEDGGGLRRFALAVHCGGCMVDAQKMRARISDLKEAGVPVTNYGMLLAYAHSPEAMKRALEPWGVHA